MHCYDILSGGASVPGYGTLKKARKVAIASFYATAIQALVVTMALSGAGRQYCVELTDVMIETFCSTAFCLFNSLVARRLTLLRLPKNVNLDVKRKRD